MDIERKTSYLLQHIASIETHDSDTKSARLLALERAELEIKSALKRLHERKGDSVPFSLRARSFVRRLRSTRL